MATTELTGRRVTNLSNEVLILPQGGLPEPAPNGAIVLEGEKLYVRSGDKWNTLAMIPVESGLGEPTTDARVSGAGSVGCNGTYKKEVAPTDTWRKPNSAFYVSRITGYPQPGADAWAIRQNDNVFYTAPTTGVLVPWDGEWTVSSFGTDPVPTVEEVV